MATMDPVVAPAVWVMPSRNPLPVLMLTVPVATTELAALRMETLPAVVMRTVPQMPLLESSNRTMLTFAAGFAENWK